MVTAAGGNHRFPAGLCVGAARVSGMANYERAFMAARPGPTAIRIEGLCSRMAFCAWTLPKAGPAQVKKINRQNPLEALKEVAMFECERAYLRGARAKRGTPGTPPGAPGFRSAPYRRTSIVPSNFVLARYRPARLSGALGASMPGMSQAEPSTSPRRRRQSRIKAEAARPGAEGCGK